MVSCLGNQNSNGLISKCCIFITRGCTSTTLQNSNLEVCLNFDTLSEKFCSNTWESAYPEKDVSILTSLDSKITQEMMKQIGSKHKDQQERQSLFRRAKVIK